MMFLVTLYYFFVKIDFYFTGRKIEVKILTPNYLDDDERDPLTTFSKEETEAFQNMIVNILVSLLVFC